MPVTAVMPEGGKVFGVWVKPEGTPPDCDVHLDIESHPPAFVIGHNTQEIAKIHFTPLCVSIREDEILLQYNDHGEAKFSKVDEKLFYDHVVDFLNRLKKAAVKPE